MSPNAQEIANLQAQVRYSAPASASYNQAVMELDRAVAARNTEANFYREIVSAQQKDNRDKATQENSAREATLRYWKRSKGEGITRDPEPVQFGLVFLEEPSFTTGSANAKNHADDGFGDPYGGASVRYWIRNERGHYLGAYITYWSSVQYGGALRNSLEQAQLKTYQNVPGSLEQVEQVYRRRASLEFELVHSLAFHGFGYKAPAPEVVNEIAVIQPRVITYE